MATATLSHLQSLIFIAGLSGAGKSHALDTFEDAGFFALDNLPVPLLRQFVECSLATPAKYTRTALLLDIDTRERLSELEQIIREIDPAREKTRLVFLDATAETIIRRYSETRRPHPNFDPNKDQSLQDTILRERRRLSPLREAAHFVVDTSSLTVHDLRRELTKFIEGLPFAPARGMRVNFLSFGFKFGVPIDCDLVIDVRFLPNPHFIDALRERTGIDPEVSRYVLSSTYAEEFLTRYVDFLGFLLPRYVYEGKSYLNIGVGCTGGKHRSVTIAEEMSRRVSGAQYLISVKHRDVERR